MWSFTAAEGFNSQAGIALLVLSIIYFANYFLVYKKIHGSRDGS